LFLDFLLTSTASGLIERAGALFQADAESASENFQRLNLRRDLKEPELSKGYENSY